MSQDFSFDVSCGFDKQEMNNALDQARREIANRFDFKGVLAEIEANESEIILLTESDYKVQALIDLIESKLVKRNIPLSVLDKSKPAETASGGNVRKKLTLISSLSPEQTKEISKVLRAAFPKIKTVIQGDSVRVFSKSKDDLQQSIQYLRKEFPKLPLNFGNYH